MPTPIIVTSWLEAWSVEEMWFAIRTHFAMSCSLERLGYTPVGRAPENECQPFCLERQTEKITCRRVLRNRDTEELWMVWCCLAKSAKPPHTHITHRFPRNCLWLSSDKVRETQARWMKWPHLRCVQKVRCVDKLFTKKSRTVWSIY